MAIFGERAPGVDDRHWHNFPFILINRLCGALLRSRIYAWIEERIQSAGYVTDFCEMISCKDRLLAKILMDFS